ncbi:MULTISPECIES: hypothetical protein [Bacillaceae]|uniref:Small, acid-soluble spore protein N n=1 Tax=Ectobacillus funiculus TaxID=137993 RepID=A0ABV5WQP5_9BACI
MPYNKDEQQAFQAAQQGTKEAVNIASSIVANDPDYASQLKHLRKEVGEAYEQIQNALESATETQYDQLQKYEQDLRKIMQDVDGQDSFS